MGHAAKANQERARIRRSMPDLLERLHEQMRFIDKSAREYDNGDEAEARRIAGHLRILLVDGGSSHSLLAQIDVAERVLMLGSSPPIDPTNLLNQHPLIMLRVSSLGVRYMARLADGAPAPVRMLRLPDWMSEPVIRTGQGTLTREGCIRSVANQDGGAHVDPVLKEPFASISRSNAIGWMSQAGTDPGKDPVNDPVLATIRQIGYEIQCSYRNYVDRGVIPAPSASANSDS